MRATCPSCGTDGHLSSFMAETDAKRFAVLLTTMPPDLGRATIDYLGLFKPAKTALRLPRVIKLADELLVMVQAGTVTNDERGGVRRPATPAQWAAGIEQMLAQRPSLTLPLKGHNYLRAIVFGLADQADAAAERQRETNARVGKHLANGSEKTASTGESKLENVLRYIGQQLSVDAITPEEAAHERAEARRKYGSG